MNKELINDLRLEAGLSRLHDNVTLIAVTKEGGINDPLVGLEKFAELIVQECEMALNPILRDMISRDKAIRLIKEHFGIE
jgi:hypothetical protein